jgi:F0F1-type ATP synthase membrane subunit b/b'
MELANTYYVIGIICMSLITIILIALIIVAVVIKLKIDRIHRAIEDRLHSVKDFAGAAEHLAKKAKEKFTS